MSQHSLLGCFLEHTRNRPAAPAMIWRRQPVSYGELGAMARRALTRLKRLPLDGDEPVAIVGPTSPESIALIIACLAARRPFLLPSAELPDATLRALLDQVGCRQVWSPATLESGLPAMPAESAAWPEPGDPPAPGAVSFLLTTSGSTGLPKVVPLTVGAVDRFTDWAAEQFQIGPGSRVANYAPLNFDLCLIDIWTTLKRGGCVVPIEREQATNALYVLDLLRSNDVQVLQAVPMLYELLVDATREDRLSLDAVEHVIFTGDAMRARCLAELPELFGKARFYNVYGCTETNDSLLHELDAAATRAVSATPPLGRPLPGVRVLIVDHEGRVVTGAGAGELWVVTPFQTNGYLDATLNAAKFAAHPDGADSARYYRTGDLVRRHQDGTLTLEGRNDFVVKVRGVRVNTQHVERVIADHEHVREAAVVAVPDARAGHRLHATVQREAASGLTSLVLREYCARWLARPDLPSTVLIVDAPLPRTSTGKVDRTQLQREHRRPKRQH